MRRIKHTIFKRRLKQHKYDRKVYRSLPYVEVIQGRFYRTNAHGVVHLNNHLYNWRVDRNTRHIKDAKVGRIASVYNSNKHVNNHKSFIVITKIIHAKGSVARKMALQLYYVINFYNEAVDPKTHQIVMCRRHQTQ